MVAPSWPQFEDVLTRYAAAKAFASWSLYLGDGVEAAAETARIAAAVLRIECARQCRAFGRPLDRELLSNAIEQSDLLCALRRSGTARYFFDGSSAGLT